MPSLRVHFLPRLTSPEELADGDVVVIDVLRASTVIIHALAAGAREVVPCQHVEQARQLAAGYPAGEVLLGGERGGLPIEGFDLGNSPADYTPQRVAGKTVVFTTTNGTRAMMNCRYARWVVVGTFVNHEALCEVLSASEDVHLLCAGTNGRISREDVLFAGAVVAEMTTRLEKTWRPDDPARIARDVWIAATGGDRPDGPLLASELSTSLGGENLQRLALAADIDDAARMDRFTIVPVLDVRRMRIYVP